MKKLYAIALVLIALSIFSYPALPQMSDTCSDGQIVAIDIVNKRYKCIIVPIVLNSVNVDLTTQGAAIASTPFFTTMTAGVYRVTWTATITRAASVSSVLGGIALGLQVVYTNADDSTLITTPSNLSGAINVANIVGGQAGGQIIVYAKAGTTINYQIGYTSVGGTTMQFSLHIRLEALQ